MDIKISVIIPVYNMEKYLGQCLESVLGQTLSGIQIICIDDGSTDNTHMILENYRSKYLNISVLYQNRKGAGDARNKGLEHARGEFVAFMDSDDYYASNDVLEVLYNYAVLYGVKAVGGNLLRDLEGKITNRKGELFQNCVFEQDAVINFSDYQFCWGYTCFIFNREMLRQNNIVFPPYIRGQDPPFMLMALSHADKIGIVAKDIYVARAFDKKVKYNSINIINDIARCLYDIITFSIKHNYIKLLETGIQELERWKIYFFLHLICGNISLQNILQKLNEKIVNSKYKKSDGYYIDMSINDIKIYIEKYLQKIDSYIRRMNKEIIVYGAGQVGKSVYDMIDYRCPEKFLGFAVSDRAPGGTARGKEICCIDKFLEKRKSALVIIAGMPNISGQMVKKAKELGFENKLVIDEEIIDLENFKQVDDKFAVY